jgi:hypothetical protein
MNKSQKELAFLRELAVEADWTARFTDIFDENFKFSGEEKILYVNAGTGSHALFLRQKLKEKAELFGVVENEELLHIAQAKAEAVRARVNFTEVFPNENFDAVLADASFVRPEDLTDFLLEAIELSDGQVAFFLPTSGSFGEIFSFLWETLLNADLLEKGENVERLISEIPTVSELEELAAGAGLKNLQTVTKNEIFEFKNGADFLDSTLIADFLLPVWLEFLSEKEKSRVSENLAQTIDAEDGTMTFRFSVKATLVVGEK